MDLSILTIEHKIRISRHDKVIVYLDGDDGKRKFYDLSQGDYALVKIETLNDRIAIEKYIEDRKNK